MKGDARDLVAELVLGVLPDDQRERMAAARATDAALDEQVRLGGLVVDRLADALPPVALAPGGRARLLATLASPDRFKAFFPVLRSWFDLDDDGLRAALARIDAGTSWIDLPFPGVRYFHFAAGPAAVGKEAGCLVLSPGAHFPRHAHAGPERSLILEGTLLLDGRALHTGSVVESAAGTSHEFAAGPGRELVLVVIHDGISFGA